MAKLIWDNVGEHFFETGTDHGVLYPADNTGAYPKGVVWNGLTAVTESPSGAESTPQYADNIKYLNLISAEDFGLTIEAFTYPDEFMVCDGSVELLPGVIAGQQTRKAFGFSWRTLIGNEVENTNYGYKLHLAYNCLASPSERAYQTVSDSPEAITFSWDVTTTPVPVSAVSDTKPTALIIIDSSKVEDMAKLKALEDILYGTDTEEARLPLPDEVYDLLKPEPAAG